MPLEGNFVMKGNLGDDQQVYFENHPMKEEIGRGLEKGFLGACLEMGMRVAK